MVFLRRTELFALEEELGTSLSLGMAAAFIRGALIFTLSITSWLQCGSLSLVAQILHPASGDELYGMEAPSESLEGKVTKPKHAVGVQIQPVGSLESFPFVQGSLD
ncbi:hypothetical protein H920_11019 [Fukomys damarensis]|uniref:Uncharacterized protein n=1 Tax=Fukomys damarensis TaxID=885580 RepID=A0A091D927_FUKDA|nr:hypothetical protein H920_11019 [Fukomys damarensis]